MQKNEGKGMNDAEVTGVNRTRLRANTINIPVDRW